MKVRMLTFILVLSLTACAGLGLGLDNRRVQYAFDTAKAKVEQRAMDGTITWVQATKEIRDLDKYVATRTDLDSTWKYDSDDEEYHAYCIALAERLDRKEISFAEFEAARQQRFNAIRTRRQSLNVQQQIIDNMALQQITNNASRPSLSTGGITCFKQREWTSGLNKNCVYDCLGSEAVQTVGATQLCPLTISR